MLDQAEALRRLVAKQSHEDDETICNKKRAKILTITSGKGGVGKSNLVVNLAIAMGKMGKKVLILDADIGMANDDILMGFLPKYDVSDIVINNMNIEDVLITGPFGIKLLPGGSGITKLEQLPNEKRDEFIGKIASLEDFDFILMDTGAGASKQILSYIKCCHELIIITTPEPTSLTDAYSLLKIVNNLKIKSSANLIINKSLNIKEALVTYNKFSNTVEKFLNIELNYLGHIIRDKKVEEAVRRQQPFIIGDPNCIASKNVLSITNRVLNNNDEPNLGIQEFFKKVFHIFS